MRFLYDKARWITQDWVTRCLDRIDWQRGQQPDVEEGSEFHSDKRSKYYAGVSLRNNATVRLGANVRVQNCIFDSVDCEIEDGVDLVGCVFAGRENAPSRDGSTSQRLQKATIHIGKNSKVFRVHGCDRGLDIGQDCMIGNCDIHAPASCGNNCLWYGVKVLDNSSVHIQNDAVLVSVVFTSTVVNAKSGLLVAPYLALQKCIGDPEAPIRSYSSAYIGCTHHVLTMQLGENVTILPKVIYTPLEMIMEDGSKYIDAYAAGDNDSGLPGHMRIGRNSTVCRFEQTYMSYDVRLSVGEQSLAVLQGEHSHKFGCMRGLSVSIPNRASAFL